MQCFAFEERRCPAPSAGELAGQHYCPFHYERIRAAALESHEVYFARRGDEIKIGISREPAQRMRSLRAELLATEHGGRAREGELHRMFAAYRLHGEWFAAAPALLTYLESRARAPEATSPTEGTES